MLDEIKKTDLFCEYYARWITVYKQGAIRKVCSSSKNVSKRSPKRLAPWST